MQLKTTNTKIFEEMDDDSLTRNYKAYKMALVDPRTEDDKRGYLFGLKLCEEEMDKRGVRKPY